MDKLQIKGNLEGCTVNGKRISDNSNTYTLLEDDGNTVKSAENSSVKSLTIDALIQMYKQLELAYFVNMIISGDAEKALDVDWKLTNIVFEGDMSKIKNTGTSSLTGIVYFKKQAYKNTGKQSVEGLLKLDSLEGVSNGTFNVYLNKTFAVLDVRGGGKKADSYTGGSILASGAYAHAIYFSNDLDSIKNSPTEINKLTNKFSNMQVTGMGFINVYLGSDRVNGESYGDDSTQSIIGAKNPRSLKEFEYLGNYYEDNGSYRFEKSAKETYGNEFDNLSSFDQGKLNSNPYTIALNNKRCFSSTAKSLG